jgi:hypothetical protein
VYQPLCGASTPARFFCTADRSGQECPLHTGDCSI